MDIQYCGGSKFLPNYAQLVEPLRKLLREKSEFCWTPQHDDCFRKVQSLLTAGPILREFDPRLPVEISTDASNMGIGATLGQRDSNGHDYVVLLLLACYPNRKVATVL